MCFVRWLVLNLVFDFIMCLYLGLVGFGEDVCDVLLSVMVCPVCRVDDEMLKYFGGVIGVLGVLFCW